MLNRKWRWLSSPWSTVCWRRWCLSQWKDALTSAPTWSDWGWKPTARRAAPAGCCERLCWRQAPPEGRRRWPSKWRLRRAGAWPGPAARPSSCPCRKSARQPGTVWPGPSLHGSRSQCPGLEPWSPAAAWRWPEVCGGSGRAPARGESYLQLPSLLVFYAPQVRNSEQPDHPQKRATLRWPFQKHLKR